MAFDARMGGGCGSDSVATGGDRIRGVGRRGMDDEGEGFGGEVSDWLY